MKDYRFICDKHGFTVQKRSWFFIWQTLARFNSMQEANTLIRNLKIIEISKINFTGD